MALFPLELRLEFDSLHCAGSDAHRFVGFDDPVVDFAGVEAVDFRDFGLGTVTSDQNGALYFRQFTSGGTGFINGFELTAIPEPSTFAAMVFGGLVLMARRRRRALVA